MAAMPPWQIQLETTVWALRPFFFSPGAASVLLHLMILIYQEVVIADWFCQKIAHKNSTTLLYERSLYEGNAVQVVMASLLKSDHVQKWRK